MKEYRFKDAFLGFTKDKLKKQIDEILMAMRLNSAEETERIRVKLAGYLGSSIRAMNVKRRRKGQPLLQDLLDHPVYLIAQMVKTSDSEEEFKSRLEEVFTCREDSYYAASPSLAARVLGPFPWAWKFPVDGVTGSEEEKHDTGHDTEVDIAPPCAETNPASFEMIMEMLARDWPQMKALLDMSECDYDIDHKTLVILPPAPVFRDVVRLSDDLHTMLARHFERVTIEVLNPGPVVDTQTESRKSEIPASPGKTDRVKDEHGSKTPAIVLSTRDRTDIEHILDAMQFKNTAGRDETRARLEIYVQNSINKQNRRRTVAGLPHVKGVREIPIYVFSKIIPGSKDMGDFMKRVRESFPVTPHLWNPSAVKQSIGSFPWAWGFDPKAKRTETTREPVVLSGQGTKKETAPEILETKPKAVQQTIEADPRMSEVNGLTARLDLLESVFRCHIHSDADGSTYIPMEAASDAIASEGRAS